jgi:hypothetical protein
MYSKLSVSISFSDHNFTSLLFFPPCLLHALPIPSSLIL